VVPSRAIELTCAASCSPLMASSETVAVWPTLTLLMSDSLKAMVIVNELVLTISAKGLLELDEPLDPLEPLDPPRLPADEAPVAPEPEPELEVELEPEPELDEEPPPAEIGSPGETEATEAMVPAAGA
jgi:hypothetical protein